MAAASDVCPLVTREALLRVARTLPADLRVLSKLGEMLQDVNAELDDISSLLCRDVALSAGIVRISNSVMFSGAGRVSSIQEAVNRVGFSEILRLVGTATTGRFTEGALDFYGISADTLRANMLYGAFAAEALARPAGIDPRTAYTAGLLRTLGFIVFDRSCRGVVKPDQAFGKGPWTAYAGWEESLAGMNSCEISAMLLDEWKFPPEASAAVRSHYLAQPADYERPLAALLNVANGLTHRVGRSFAGEGSWWEITPQKLAAAGLKEDDFELAIGEIEAAFDAAMTALAN
ncbi:HDOD domain-containing protein [Horticoccus sp. 23ND18S-11]|uniref:HDOD domain-containing protein n=1 Tax=Horticoccus sp. 23ND18S-11 TaxID=3391832 RepID=UPI0039C953D4